MKTFIIFITLSVPPIATAQVNDNKRPPAIWNLKNAIAYAKQNNITINSLKLNELTSEQNVVQSKAARYPNLAGAVSEGLSNYKTGVSTSSSYGFNSSVTLYNGGLLNNDIKENKLSLQAAQLDIAAAENDITLQITQAYLNILLAEENLVYLEDLVTTSEAQVLQAQQRFTAGTLAKKDLLQIEAVLANDKYNVVTAENTKLQYILTLKQILQLPSAVSFEIDKADTIQVTALTITLAEAQ